MTLEFSPFTLCWSLNLSPKTKGNILHCPVTCSTKPSHFPSSKQVLGYTEISHIPRPIGALVIPVYVVVQSLSHVQLFVTPWTAVLQASLSFAISQNFLILCPLSRWCHSTISSSDAPFSSCPQSFPASGSFPMSQFFAFKWPKYWSFTFSISPSSEYSGLISFRMDWLDLLAVQGTLKSLI